MKDEYKSLLSNLRPVQQSPSFCNRFARIKSCVMFLFVVFAVLYIVSYLRLVDLPKKKTTIPSPFTLLPSKNLTDSQNVADRPYNLEISRTLQRNTKTERKIACRIPQLDPFHETVQPFLQEEPAPLKCEQKYPAVFKLGLNFTVVRERNTEGWKDCCYKIISRSKTAGKKVDDEVIYSEDCVSMPQEVTQIPTEIEFIGIYCKIPERQKKILKIIRNFISKQLIDAFAFIPVKAETNKTAFSRVNDLNDKLSVLIYGIDGVSRTNFFRIMPQVHKFLIQSLSAISMDSYVKVGDNTFPNLIAILAAMNRSNVEESCGKNKFYDDCPFLWKYFSGQGYKTAFSEDAPTMGVFNYKKHGFIRPPVDYYLRPLGIVLNAKLGSEKRAGANLCYGPRSATEVLLNHMQKMAVSMNPMNQRYFQYTWATSLTHDRLNFGKLGEKATLETLQWFQKEGHLNKTLLIVMSDHGLRFGKFRKTKQGQIEESLPFLYFVFPDWFKQKYPSAIENMKKNTNRLTTPFDLHETLLDILNTTNLQEREIDKRNEILNSQRQKNEVPRGISMFLPSPPERTCEMAAIPEHYCVCHKTEDLGTKSSLAQQAANFAVNELNSFTSKYIKCTFLTLQNVTSANVVDLIESSKGGEQVVKISFVTSPGDAEFEGTIVRRLQNSKTYSWSLSDVSRVNLYANDSHCISDTEVKKYCYCNDLLKKI